MFEFLKETCQKGQCISVECPNGKYVGEIIFIGADSIGLKQSNGKPVGIKGTDIAFFEQIDYKNGISDDIDAVETTTKDNETKIVDTKVSNPKIEELGKTDNPKVEDTNNPIEPEQPSNGLKILGKIPIDELEKMGGTKIKKNKQKVKTIGNDFGVLESLVSEKHAVENSQIVSAKGEVSQIFRDKNFGFIQDGKTKRTIFFNLHDVIDSELGNYLGRYVPVVYTMSSNDKGDKAKDIHKPKSIAEIIKMAEREYKNGNNNTAIGLLNHILDEYPDNFSASQFKNEIEKSIPNYKAKNKIITNYYYQAKQFDINKNYDKAIEFYQKALDAGEKEETCIKDLAMLYAAIYKNKVQEGLDAEKERKRAVNFITNHEKMLQNVTSTHYFLENLYYSLKEFDKFIQITDILLNDRNVTKDKRRHTAYLVKKAAALIQLEEYGEAEDIVDEVLALDSANIGALKLKKSLEEDNENIEQIASEIEIEFKFNSYNGSGLSSYIKQLLDNYEDYFGVPPKIVESKDFSDTTLKSLRNVIEGAGRARPKERARYLLTEGKLMQLLEPNNYDRLCSVMARYCNAMALNHLYDHNDYDIIRFYYIESFNLENTYDANARQVSLYLTSYLHNYDELVKAIDKNPSIDDVLQLLLNHNDNRIWDGLLSMFLSSSTITNNVLSKVFSDRLLREVCERILNEYYKVQDMPKMYDKEKFVSIWQKLIDRRLNDYRNLTNSIVSLGDCKNLEELENILFPKIEELKRENNWICDLDLKRLNQITNNVLQTIKSYIHSSGFKNKNGNYLIVSGMLNTIDEEIVDGPTKLSYEAILPLVTKIRNLLDVSFDNVKKSSEPKITIKLLSENTVENKGIVPVQILVANDKDSAPIYETQISIEETEDITIKENADVYYNQLDGDDSQIFRLKIKVSNNVKDSKATAINVKCKYKYDDNYKEIKVSQSLRLYSADEYEEIPNPYAPLSDGGPMTADSPMFYGRKTFIKEKVDAILNAQSKQIIIYGQKRCGKSSVLNQLKKDLENTGNVFCVKFSMGEIIQNISEVSFYYKILSSIRSELESLEFDGFGVPKFEIPKFAEFRSQDDENPLNTFIDYVKRFKRLCKQCKGWESKKLVVMIDEFTYLYSQIKVGKISPTIMKQWKAITQNEETQFSVVLVGQDVVPSFKKEDYARNAFGVIEDVRLTYLSDNAARSLIEEPIFDKYHKTRYIGDAVTKIIEYTSSNPYYIQIFCARMVAYMNQEKIISVTEADVEEVAQSFIKGAQALTSDKFDGLLKAGEEKDTEEFDENDVLEVLIKISKASKNIGRCTRDEINALENKELEDQIIKNLEDREVLSLVNGFYKIQVKLFQEWLLNH